MGKRGVDRRPTPVAAWAPRFSGSLGPGYRDWPLLHKRVNGVSHGHRVYRQAPEYLAGPALDFENTHQNVLGLDVRVAPS